MKKYRIVKVEAKRTYFKIQKYGILGIWRDLRSAVSGGDGFHSELIAFNSEESAKQYLKNNLAPFEFKQTVIAEYSF